MGMSRHRVCQLFQAFSRNPALPLAVILFLASSPLFFCAESPTNSFFRETQDCTDPPTTYSGEATFYASADGSGACCFPATPLDLMIGAMNYADYDGSYACGSCVELTGPNGTIDIRIVDECPECLPGDIDLSPTAFEKIARLDDGRVPITWHVIPCPVTGPILYHFKEGTNANWTAVQIRNHRYPILRLEYQKGDGNFEAMTRSEYNYFIVENGLGPGPYTFRVTDLYGQVLTDSDVALNPNGDIAGAGQFPECE